MVDPQTRESILRDSSYGVLRENCTGRTTRRDILELLLKGYSCKEITAMIGIHKSSMTSHISRLKKSANASSVPEMLRKMVIKHRGYL